MTYLILFLLSNTTLKLMNNDSIVLNIQLEMLLQENKYYIWTRLAFFLHAAVIMLYYNALKR